ncbi:MAG: efflux RND transporter permease subunit [Candidatus Pacearchaeota archaeon]
MQNKIFKEYSKFVSNKPWTILIVSLIITAIMLYGFMNLKTVNMNYEDMLPEENEVINSFKIISEEFGGENSITIVIELDNLIINSDEPLDIRDPRVISYIDKLSQQLIYVKDVTSVSSVSELIKTSNNNYIPNTQNEIIEILNKPALSYQVSSFVSKDNSMSLINVKLSEDSDDHSEEIEQEISLILDHSNKPAGISVTGTGDILKDPQIEKIITDDMSKTSLVAIIGIIFILLIIFRSFKYGFLPLTSIIFGVLWAMGFLGLIGLGLNTMTSGTISMIMGIGIDFGIQIIVRFKHEFKTADKRKAMEKTMNAVLGPIGITTLAAIIGFRAMSWGELTMMAEMGNIMSLGVIFCMFAAITVVPSLVILVERDKPKKQ